MTATTNTIIELKREIRVLETDQTCVKHDGVRDDIKLRVAKLKQRIEFLQKQIVNNGLKNNTL